MAVPVEAILADMETKILKARLLEFPSLIRRQKSVVAKARKALQEMECALKEAEANLVVEISAEMNPSTGKPAFSNAEARTAELRKRQKDDPAYKEAASAHRDAEWAMSEAQGDLEKFYDQFKGYRYVVDLTASELKLLAGGIGEEQGGARQDSQEPF